MAKYEVTEYSTKTEHYECIFTATTFEETVEFCRDIVQNYRRESRELVENVNYVYIYGEDKDGRFRALWVRKVSD